MITESTQGEARALARYLRKHPLRSVLVVTSDYHTRRARWTLRRELTDQRVELRMAGAPASFSARHWWRSEEGLMLTLEEYLKFVHTWLRS